MGNGYYLRRRGVYEHLEARDLDLLDLGIHDWLCGHARTRMGGKVPAGVWIGSAQAIYEQTGEVADINARRLRRRLERLEGLGYFRKFRVNKSTFAYVINKLNVQDVTGTWYQVNAAETMDWRTPKYELDRLMTGWRPAGDLLVTGNRPAGMSNKGDVETEEIEENVRLTDDERSSVSSSAATLPSAPMEDGTGKTIPAASAKAKATSPANIPSTVPAPPPASDGNVSSVHRTFEGAAAPKAAATPPDNLSDMREWPIAEERFGVSGDRLRNCLVFCIDHRKDSYYRDNPPTVASMNREKFVRNLDKDTPPGWTPEWTRKRPEPSAKPTDTTYTVNQVRFD